MQFDSFADFFNMGGYAFYVWLSFGITFTAMLIVAVQSYVKHKSLLNTVMVEKARQTRIKKAREEESKKA